MNNETDRPKRRFLDDLGLGMLEKKGGLQTYTWTFKELAKPLWQLRTKSTAKLPPFPRAQPLVHLSPPSGRARFCVPRFMRLHAVLFPHL